MKILRNVGLVIFLILELITLIWNFMGAYLAATLVSSSFHFGFSHIVVFMAIGFILGIFNCIVTVYIFVKEDE